MPTIRSEYGFDQFETVLQKLVHKVAIDVVTNLPHSGVRIEIGSSGFRYLDTGEYTVRFSPSHISFMKRKENEYWGFDIEEKLYNTSSHRTKISFVVSVPDVYNEKTQRYEELGRREKEKQREKEILEFLNKLMDENSMKPVPRFSLKAGPIA